MNGISTIALKRILLPTDFSEASRQAFPEAVALAQQFGASINLVYVLPTALPAELSHIGVVLEEKRLVQEAEKRLAKFRIGDLPADITVENSVLSGGPYREICLAARSLAADLIVMSTHGHTGTRHALLGSTTERVVRHAPCPVLTIRERLIPVRFPETSRSRFRRIIVPTDFSAASRKALFYAIAFARESGAGIRLLHVIEPAKYYDLDPTQAAITEAHLEQAAGAKLDRERQSCGVETTSLVRSGVAFQEIVHEAADQSADLIVLATGGHTWLKHVFLGSTAERVVRHAACPVLVVREREHEFVNA